MRKTAKFTAIVLAVVLALSCFSVAFAAWEVPEWEDITEALNPDNWETNFKALKKLATDRYEGLFISDIYSDSLRIPEATINPRGPHLGITFANGEYLRLINLKAFDRIVEIIDEPIDKLRVDINPALEKLVKMGGRLFGLKLAWEN